MLGRNLVYMYCGCALDTCVCVCVFYVCLHTLMLVAIYQHFGSLLFAEFAGQRDPRVAVRTRSAIWV